jgi:hypothetical protein
MRCKHGATAWWSVVQRGTSWCNTAEHALQQRNTLQRSTALLLLALRTALRRLAEVLLFSCMLRWSASLPAYAALQVTDLPIDASRVYTLAQQCRPAETTVDLKSTSFKSADQALVVHSCPLCQVAQGTVRPLAATEVAATGTQYVPEPHWLVCLGSVGNFRSF